MTDGGKANTVFSNTVEPRAPHDICTPLYTQDSSQIFIYKCQHYHF